MAKSVFGPPSSGSAPSSSSGRFVGSILGIWRFNDTLEDIVSGNDFNATVSSPSYKPIKHFDLLTNTNTSRYALLFQNNVPLVVSPSYSYSNDFTITFWWYSPKSVGYTKNIVNRSLQTKISPIIAKSDYIISNSKTVLQHPSFVITEISHSKTHNAIQIHLSGDSENITHVINSEPYEPGLRHVLFTYTKSTGRIRVDIDGKLGISHSGPINGISSIGSLQVNTIAPGPIAYREIQSNGYLYDLVMTTFSSTEDESLKMMRYGYEYITVVGLFGARFDYFGLSFPQPTTISTNQILVEGGNIYCSRSNGEILKGTRPIWDKEFAYESSKQVSLLNISEVDPPESPEPSDNSKRIAEWTSSGLRMKGTIIRI